jgi:hypothetical protein
MKPTAPSLVIAALVAGCASAPSVDLQKVADNRYEVKASATPAQGGMVRALQLATDKANGTCAATGGEADLGSLRSEDLSPAPSVATIRFFCVLPARPDAVANSIASARRYIEARRTQNVNVLMTMTDLRSLDPSFTREKATRTLEAMFAAMRERKLVQTMELPADGYDSELLRDGTTYYKFFRFTMDLQGPGIASNPKKEVFLAFSEDQGRTWAFVDTQQKNPAVIRKVLPGYQPVKRSAG